jgi:hypothetical protein
MRRRAAFENASDDAWTIDRAGARRDVHLAFTLMEAGAGAGARGRKKAAREGGLKFVRQASQDGVDRRDPAGAHASANDVVIARKP